MGLITKLGLQLPLDTTPLAAERLDLAPLQFPVTIGGLTRAQIQQRIRDDREGLALSFSDVQQQLELHRLAEQALAPLAAAVEQFMKTPIAQRVAEIHANTNEKLRGMGRDAANARGVVRLTESVYEIGAGLLKSARGELGLARKALDAQNMSAEAAELRAKIEEIEASCELLGDLLDKAGDIDLEDATIVGAAFDLVAWGMKGIAGVDRLKKQADDLEATAKALKEAVVREAFAAAAGRVQELTRQVRPLLDRLAENLKSYHQQRSEVEQLYDRRSKGAFRFAAFEKALTAGEHAVATLDAAALDAATTTRRVQAVHDWLAAMVGLEALCRPPHHAKAEAGANFEPDPRRVHEETVAMKDEMRDAIRSLAAARKRAETMSLGIRIEQGEALERRRRWMAYCDAAQTALFLAPEPATGGD
jgi:hypothetical protein